MQCHTTAHGVHRRRRCYSTKSLRLLSHTMEACSEAGIWPTADATAAAAAAEGIVYWRLAAVAAASCGGMPQELVCSRACSMFEGAHSMPACACTPMKLRLLGRIEHGRRLHQLGPCRAIAATPRSLQQYPRSLGSSRGGHLRWVFTGRSYLNNPACKEGALLGEVTLYERQAGTPSKSWLMKLAVGLRIIANVPGSSSCYVANTKLMHSSASVKTLTSADPKIWQPNRCSNSTSTCSAGKLGS